MSVRVGIDVGGTFTDFVLADGAAARLVFHKEPSTPADPARAVADGLVALVAKAGLSMDQVSLVVHGTTLALNAILQRRGAELALVTSPGNRDVLEIARLRMASSVDFALTKEVPLVPRDRAFEIPARLSVDGTVLAEPTEADYAALAEKIRASGVGAVAVMLLHSYRYPELEARVVAGLRQHLPGLPIEGSAAIWPEMREYERAMVAVLNAYVAPLVGAYLDRLLALLQGVGMTGRLLLTTSNGGSLGLQDARRRPIETVLSGPASGVVAAARAAHGTAFNRLVTLDMGGTSSDVALTRAGVPDYTTRTTVGDFPLVMPVVAISAIGAGGGSVVWLDREGVLKVGPHSSGAAPGPACYGRGGTLPTVTDCYVAVGWLDPANFLGGRMRLDAEAARKTLEPIAKALGLATPEHAAEAALRVATAAMATELSKAMAQRGEDPAEYALMPFGGAGPTHANLLAEEAGMPAIVVPPSASTFCALGAILADLARDFVRSLRLRLDEGAAPRLLAVVTALRAEGDAWLAAEPGPLHAHGQHATADMRYAGQSFDITVEWDNATLANPTPEAVAELFHQAHEKIYGFRDLDSLVELTALRLRAWGRLAPVVLPGLAASATAPVALGTRRIFTAGAWQQVPVYARATLAPGRTLAGPAIIELDDSTLVLRTGWALLPDPSGNLVLRPES
jgi:N-methylhydantoinase A